MLKKQNLWFQISPSAMHKAVLKVQLMLQIVPDLPQMAHCKGLQSLKANACDVISPCFAPKRKKWVSRQILPATVQSRLPRIRFFSPIRHRVRTLGLSDIQEKKKKNVNAWFATPILAWDGHRRQEFWRNMPTRDGSFPLLICQAFVTAPAFSD